MKRLILNTLFLFPVFIFYLSVSLYAQGERKITATPNELYESMSNNPAFISNAKGEDFCWNARVGMDQFVTNYGLTKNTDWLEAGIKYYDFLLARRDNDPEGFKGWIGPYEFDKRYIQDAIVGEAILMTSILDFCVLASENPELKNKYGEKIKLYLETAERDFFDKWDKRGCWVDDGPFGAYVEFSKYLKTDNLKEWFTPANSRGGTCHPFNKQMEVGQVSLRLYRITGEKKFKDRAEKIYFTVKNHFQYFDNHYCWNYWEPLVPADVNLEKNDTRHWVDVHMWWSAYQAGEVSKIVEAYHYGIVFDEQDIKRLINTNLKVMWNGDKVNPIFINSNGKGAEHDTTGKAGFLKGNGHSDPFMDAGELWTGLLDFDQTVRDIYELRFKGNKESPRYLAFKKTVFANPPSFKRKYVKGEVTVPVVNFTECKDLHLAVVLPSIVPKDGKSIIICKTRKPGDLQIDLYSKDGKKLINLQNKKIDIGLSIMTWDGKDPSNKFTFKGDYKIRWTINGGCREFPITIKY